MQKRPLARLFPVLLLNLIAFAIAIPVLPALASDLGGGPVDITLLYAIQALGQFVMAPAWGAISDRFGRRPALLATFAGAAVFEMATAFTSELWMLYVARLLVGFCAGNVATASALISDSTDASSRSKGMAIIGISFGIGFTIGAGLGAGISTLEQPGAGPLGTGLPFIVSSGLYIVTLILGLVILLEPAKDAETRKANRVRLGLASIRHLLSRPAIRLMCGLFFFYTIAVTVMEATFFIYAEAVFGFQEKEVGIIFAGFGVLMAIVQGGVGRISGVIGDRRMTGLGVILLAIGLIISPIQGGLWWLIVFLAIATIGRALIHPGTLSMTANLSEQSAETGKVMGVLQSSGSLARVIGPALGGLAFKHVAVQAPFILAGSVLALAGVAWWFLSRRDDIRALLSGRATQPQT